MIYQVAANARMNSRGRGDFSFVPTPSALETRTGSRHSCEREKVPRTSHPANHTRVKVREARRRMRCLA